MKDMQTMLDGLQAEYDKLKLECAPMIAERDKLQLKMQPFETQIAELNKAIKAKSQPRLGELEQAIRGLRLSLGLDKPPREANA